MDREIYLETSDGGLSWWFAQNVYHVEDICRAVKSGEGSGNIPKVIIEYEIQDDSTVTKKAEGLASDSEKVQLDGPKAKVNEVAIRELEN